MPSFPDGFTGIDGAAMEDRVWFEAVRKTFVVIASVVYYYDYFLTFSREVAWVWQSPRRFSWLNVLFYINRYLTFFGLGGVLMRAFWAASPDSASRIELCQALSTYHMYFGISTQVVIGVFMIARVFALYDFNRRVLAFLSLVAAGALGNGVICLCTARKAAYTLPSSSCFIQNDDHDLAFRLALAWAGLIIFDLVLFFFTLWKTLREPALGKSTIMQLLLRDGALYFAVVTLVTVVTAASYTFPQVYLRGFTATLSYAVSSCLASRLILNMRDPNLCSRFTPTDDKRNAELSTIRWAGREDADAFEDNPTFDLMVDESRSRSPSTEREDIHHPRRDFSRGQDTMTSV
ncbi:hypothetical protein BKA70DRAFT_1262446 [Coprinopsis sp. MPI-PUGE-AT-0042]|nr:hypothetical protein BKA70DRAFT_1262446 [Coprinopsis sp. MPI-PUGE-AT-0042]